VKTRERQHSNPRSRDVFLNVPFDSEFEPLFLAFIAGLSGFGVSPRTVLEIPGSQRRLERIFALLQRCPYSFHDISRVELDRTPPPTPRFNMPFELGLAVALSVRATSGHHWFVFESKNFRQQKSLSDLNGSEVYIHEGEPIGVLRAITNALANSEIRPTVAELQVIYLDLKEYSVELRKQLATATVFETRAFRDLVVAAGAIASERVAVLHGRMKTG
jgi:hypothetical protein